MKEKNKEESQSLSEVFPECWAPLLELETALFILPFRAEKKLRPVDFVPAVRSRLGSILKQRFCPYPDFGSRKCSRCERGPFCCYTLLFSPRSPHADKERGQKRGAFGDPPRPYVLNLPLGAGKGGVEPGEEAMLQLTLIGEQAVAFRRPVMESVFQAVMGLKQRFSVSPGTWHSVLPDQTGDEGRLSLSFRRGREVLGEPSRAPLSRWIRALPQWPGAGEGPGELMELRFTTPFQMKRAEEAFGFPPFVKTILARLRDLKRVYGENTHMGNFSGAFFDKAQQIMVFSSLFREEASWFSAHRKGPIDLGGWKGPLILRGDITPFMPLMAAGFLLGIGSKTVYGLGRYDIPGWELWPGTCAE